MRRVRTITNNTESKTMIYVTMTDKFMSGWGESRGKINKFVIACDTLEQAHQITKHANSRSEMKYVNTRSSRPSYPDATHLTSWRTYADMGGCWTKEGGTL